MLLSIGMIVIGLIVLVWSADMFVDGAAAVAHNLGMSTLLVGMIVVGFGTSAPEMSVSVLSAMQGNPGIALGNAYGSNIANIALVLGITALISPVVIRSRVLKKELPILLGITFLAYFHLQDGQITRVEGFVELAVLLLVFTWMTLHSRKQSSQGDTLATELEGELEDVKPLKAWGLLIMGLVLLVISSRILVLGAVDIAQGFGVSDLIIGLTVIAIGTSLPELAASIAAARKGEHDLAVGNIIGSNIFNTLAVVGLAGAIHPMQVPAEVVSRDWMLMLLLTVLLFVLGYGRKKGGVNSINRIGGGLLLAVYIGYTLYLISSIL
ncbi:MAG: calcium/sodium antiporter [Methylophilaceae bacterium]|nr:MAG: calcium/sodium antiporter [Methylophilaceae bacterium]